MAQRLSPRDEPRETDARLSWGSDVAAEVLRRLDIPYIAHKDSGCLTVGVLGDGDTLMSMNALWTAASRTAGSASRSTIPLPTSPSSPRRRASWASGGSKEVIS